MNRAARGYLARTLGCALCLLVWGGPAYAMVPEVADPDLGAVAMARAEPGQGTVVAYNPGLCRALGAACGFMRMHVQGHVYYGHPPAHPADYSDREETLADCWAARHGEPREILAAHQWFTSGAATPGLEIRGDGPARARIVRRCARQNGKWLGN